MFKPEDKIGIFIDGANHYMACQNDGIKVNFEVLLSEFNKMGRVVCSRYYTGVKVTPNNEFDPIRKMLTWLMHNGYVLVTKTAKEVAPGKFKANMDIEIAVDMLQMAHRLDHIVFFTGDGDFVYLVNEVQKLGCRVSVVSTRDFSAEELVRQADDFLDLTKLPYAENL